MRVAIIGTGIAGNVVAYKLRDMHEITVFEAGAYVGGHTNTIDVREGGTTLAVDTGFIVFNDRTYPNFNTLLAELGQEYQDTRMSFSVQAKNGNLEYCGSSISQLFAQRSNLLRPSFYRMIADILRFNRSAMEVPGIYDDSQVLGDYLNQNRYSREFREHYIVPMAAAIWSAGSGAVLDMPLSFLARFFYNHGLLQLSDRPQWRVVKGGSRRYVEKLVRAHRDRIRLNSPVLNVRRLNHGAEVYTKSGGTELFDAVVFACHSDQALAMLGDPTPVEQETLSAIRYQKNDAILHTDESLMPRRRDAWAAWNCHVPENPANHVAVTYNMNMLQGLDARRQYLVTLNNEAEIDRSKILRRFEYQHPEFSLDMVAAQQRQHEINRGRSFYCGAYWHNGFHEDGVVSALSAVEHFERRCDGEQLSLRRAS